MKGKYKNLFKDFQQVSPDYLYGEPSSHDVYRTRWMSGRRAKYLYNAAIHYGFADKLFDSTVFVPSRKYCLVIDDNPEGARFITAVVSRRYHQVNPVANPRGERRIKP